jgi:hypothetical protein
MNALTALRQNGDMAAIVQAADVGCRIYLVEQRTHSTSVCTILRQEQSRLTSKSRFGRHIEHYIYQNIAWDFSGFGF